MKKTVLTEDAPAFSQAFSGKRDFAPGEMGAPYGEKSILCNYSSCKAPPRFPDSFLTAVKWTFLYLPGVGAINGIIQGWAIFLSYETFAAELLPGTLGFLAAGTFMVMFGIGKTRDLRYLRTVGAIIMASILQAILYWSIAAVFSDDYFGSFQLASWLFAAFIGYLVKRDVDATE